MAIISAMKQEEEFVNHMLSIFDAADLDGDGSIDFSEFIKNEWQVHLKFEEATRSSS